MLRYKTWKFVINFKISSVFCSTVNTNYSYLFFISVMPTRDDMSILSTPDTLVSGTTVKLMCTISKIKPEAYEFFWTIHGQRLNGSVETGRMYPYKDGNSLSQRNTVLYR